MSVNKSTTSDVVPTSATTFSCIVSPLQLATLRASKKVSVLSSFISILTNLKVLQSLNAALHCHPPYPLWGQLSKDTVRTFVRSFSLVNIPGKSSFVYGREPLDELL